MDASDLMPMLRSSDSKCTGIYKQVILERLQLPKKCKRMTKMQKHVEFFSLFQQDLKREAQEET